MVVPKKEILERRFLDKLKDAPDGLTCLELLNGETCTKSRAWQVLNHLETEELVCYHKIKGTGIRPTHVYRITPKGIEKFVFELLKSNFDSEFTVPEIVKEVGSDSETVYETLCNLIDRDLVDYKYANVRGRKTKVFFWTEVELEEIERS